MVVDAGTYTINLSYSYSQGLLVTRGSVVGPWITSIHFSWSGGNLINFKVILTTDTGVQHARAIQYTCG
jgi:hypothetical protein